MEALSNGNIDESMNEIMQILVGFASIRKDPSVREKVMKELEKTVLFQEVVVKPSKLN